MSQSARSSFVNSSNQIKLRMLQQIMPPDDFVKIATYLPWTTKKPTSTGSVRGAEAYFYGPELRHTTLPNVGVRLCYIDSGYCGLRLAKFGSHKQFVHAAKTTNWIDMLLWYYHNPEHVVKVQSDKKSWCTHLFFTPKAVPWVNPVPPVPQLGHIPRPQSRGWFRRLLGVGH